MGKEYMNVFLVLTTVTHYSRTDTEQSIRVSICWCTSLQHYVTSLTTKRVMKYKQQKSTGRIQEVTFILFYSRAYNYSILKDEL